MNTQGHTAVAPRYEKENCEGDSAMGFSDKHGKLKLSLFSIENRPPEKKRKAKQGMNGEEDFPTQHRNEDERTTEEVVDVEVTGVVPVSVSG